VTRHFAVQLGLGCGWAATRRSQPRRSMQRHGPRITLGATCAERCRPSPDGDPDARNQAAGAGRLLPQQCRSVRRPRGGNTSSWTPADAADLASSPSNTGHRTMPPGRRILPATHREAHCDTKSAGKRECRRRGPSILASCCARACQLATCRYRTMSVVSQARHLSGAKPIATPTVIFIPAPASCR
jgi:hypothetical protein